jgi:hypothetical protein
MSNHISNLISGELTDAQIEALCSYHDNPEKYPKYKAIKEATKEMLRVIRDNCPICAGRTRALQTVLMVRMEANATIALDGVETEA